MSVEQDLFTSTQRGDEDVTQQINDTFWKAVEIGASDIHFEDTEGNTRVRMRVNDCLHPAASMTRKAAALLDSKIRMKAGLSSAERQQPLDGRFFLRFSVGGISTRVDVRVNILPIHTGGGAGQKIVCRLLDQSRAVMQLESLPFPPQVHNALNKVLAARQGMILMTGPTGSGKTSSLYAMLNRFANDEVNVMTVENPVEYTVPAFNQVSVQLPKLTFAAALRAFLRQDPDVILVGEIRDEETARIATEAALTGHLLFSTLHTNTAGQSIIRMSQKGIAPYTLAQTLLAVMAQRLIERACEHCLEKVIPDSDAQEMMRRIEYQPREMHVTRGCEHCNDTGLNGRYPILEMILVDGDVREAIESTDLHAIHRAARRQPQYRSLAHAALDACADGRTTLRCAMNLALTEDLKASVASTEIEESVVM